MLWIVFIISILGLIFAGFLARKILKQKVKDKKVEEISSYIHSGAQAFLNRQYKIVAIFAIIIAVILYFTLGEKGTAYAISFIVGAVISAIAGRFGMYI